MSFAHPVVLAVALLAIIGCIIIGRRLAARQARESLAYSNLDFMEAAIGRGVPWAAVLLGLWILALATIGAALAGPRIVANVSVRDSAVALCIDTSGSMGATDVAPTRSEAATRAARTFIDAVPDGTRIALVAFSSSAGVVLPATEDKDALRDGLVRIPPPNGGTAIGDALAVAARSLPAVRHRAIVLVTDGLNNSGSEPLVVAQTLAQAGIVVYTVGIGTSGSGLLIPGTGEAADLDEESLRAIASSTRGVYARVSDAEALRTRLSDIARTSTHETRRVDIAFPLAIAGAAFMLIASAGAFALGRYP